jgi:hypothetical protein
LPQGVIFYLDTLLDTGVVFWNFTGRGIAGKEKMDGDGKLW